MADDPVRQTNALLTQKVQLLLNSKFVQDINLKLGGLIINGAEFRKVANHIANGDIKVYLEPTLLYSAEYRPEEDELAIQDGEVSEVLARSYWVHECTHAIVDMDKAQVTRQLANEAAAYLAQAIYLNNTTEVNVDKLVKDGQKKGNGPQARAWSKIIEACEKVIDLAPPPPPGEPDAIILKREDYDGLIKVIHSAPVYRKLGKNDVMGERSDGISSKSDARRAERGNATARTPGPVVGR